MNRILVSPRSLTRAPDPDLGRLEAAGYTLEYTREGEMPGEAELLDRLPGCVGWLCGVEPVSARVLRAAAPALRVISRNGAGTDNLPLGLAAELGVVVCRAAGANAQGVAELSVALMLAAAREIAPQDAALREGRWVRRLGREIGGRMVGVVGCGAVGRRVVAACLGLGARVLGYDPFPDEEFRPGDAFRWSDLDTLIAEADVVTLHCPMPDDGAPLLDRRLLGRLRRGATIVNTARAGLVDEAALLLALDEERIGTYCTDVFATEPPAPGPLVGHRRVLATPHVGGYTVESVRGATIAAVDNLLRVLGAPC